MSSASDRHTSNEYLPVPNPTTPYWRTDLHHLDSHRSTKDLPTKCDVLIIGAGISGVSVAYHLSQPDKNRDNSSTAPSILLLEARQVCSGATGRNGGHVKVKTQTFFRSSQSQTEIEEFSAFVGAHIDTFSDIVERERLDCEFELRRSYDVFLNEKDAASMRKAWDEHSARREPWMKSRQLLDTNLAEAVSSVKDARLAFSSPVCSMWPYKFVTQLLARTMERNPALNLQTETPVLGVEYIQEGEDGSPETLVHTARGTVRAKKVVFATNAYTVGLLPQYKGVITPVKGTAAHLAPDALKGPVFPHLGHTYNLEFGINDRETVDYLNPRPDGGIVVGGGKWLFEKDRHLWHNVVDDSTTFHAISDAKYFEGYMQRVFKGWDDSGTEVDKIWTGIMGGTPDGYPHAGQVPGRKNQWVLAGYNGGGMCLAFLLGKGVAEMVLHDLPFEETDGIIPRFFKTTEERLRAK